MPPVEPPPPDPDATSDVAGHLGVPGAGPRSVRGRRRHRTRNVILLVVVAVLVVGVAVAGRIQLQEYAISPGTAQPVAPLVSVPPGRARRTGARILLTDVEISQVSLLDWLPDRLSSDTQILPVQAVLGPLTPASQLVAQGYLEMAQSQDAAKALALRTLGYTVGQRSAGVVVYSVLTGTPAAGAGLQVGQVITSVDGRSTTTACQFLAALASASPGQTVALSVEQSVPTAHGTLRPGAVVVTHVRLARRPRSVGASGPTGCPGVPSLPTGFLGISTETQIDFTYPFPVHVATQSIGGPSAGLAMTLGIVAKLSGDDVTGGHIVAATGTIDASGQVGDVSGVPQKTIAVERAGATAFLVPPQELAAARSKATPGLHVYAVSTFAQALGVLRSLGGRVPRP